MVATSEVKSVRERAFELYLERGELHGNDREDWFQAEKQIQDLNNQQKPIKRTVKKL